MNQDTKRTIRSALTFIQVACLLGAFILFSFSVYASMLRREKDSYDAGYKAGVESAEEEDEDEGSDFIGEDYLWKV